MEGSKERMRLPPEYYWGDTLRDTIGIASRLRRISEMSDPLIAVPNMHFDIPYGFPMEFAGELVSAQMQDRVQSGELVVIDDRSHGQVVGIRKLNQVFKIVSLQRDDQQEYSTFAVKDLQVYVAIKNWRVCEVFLHEVSRGKTLNEVMGITIRSDGEMIQGGFIIATDREVLFGQVQNPSTQTFGVAYDDVDSHMVRWLVSGHDKERVLRQHGAW